MCVRLRALVQRQGTFFGQQQHGRRPVPLDSVDCRPSRPTLLEQVQRKKERKKERKNKKDRKSIRAIGKTTCSFFFFFSCVFFSFFFGSQPKKKRASPTNQGTRLALTESVSLLNKLTLIAEVYLVATICPHWYLLLPNCLTSVCFKVDLISPISS